MELHKPDLMQKDKEKQGRDKGERTVTAFFYDLWSAGEDKPAHSPPFLVQFALFQHTWNIPIPAWVILLAFYLRLNISLSLICVFFTILVVEVKVGAFQRKPCKDRACFARLRQLVQSPADGSVCSTVTLRSCHFECRSLPALARSFTQTNRPCQEVRHSANMLWCFAARRYLHTCQVRYFSICMKTSILRCA